MTPTAWYDPSNGVVSTDRDCPLFTPLGQVWPLHPRGDMKEELTKLLMESYDRGVTDGLNTVVQLIKELRPAILPIEGMGKGKSTQEWFDILVETIKEKQ